MKLPGVTRDEKRQLKEWLTSIKPDDMSRNDIADEFEVTRRTISTMLSPSSTSFGTGLTMLRYLQLAGAVVDAPEASPASSRLAALEAQVEAAAESMTAGLAALAEEVRALARTQEPEGRRARKAS